MSMSERLGIVRQWAQTLCVIISALSGVISLLLVAFYGGGVVEKVNGHERRISAIEDAASTPAQKHIVEDAARDMALSERVAKIESALGAIPFINDKLATLVAGQGALKESLDKHERQSQR